MKLEGIRMPIISRRGVQQERPALILMAFHFHTSARIGDVPLRDLQSYLKDRGRLSREDAYDPFRGPLLRACLDHCLVVGLQPPRRNFDLTDLGHAVRTARFMPRRSLREASAVFRSLCQNLQKIEQDGIIKITGFWLYGSLMRQDRMIGDIDIVLDWERQSKAPEHMVQKLMNSLQERNGERFLGGKQQALDAYLAGILIDASVVDFISLQSDDFELRTIGAPCEKWSPNDSGEFHCVKTYAEHPLAIGKANSRSQKIMTDRGVFRSSIPSDDILDAAIMEGVEGILSETISAAGFAGLYRDLEMRYGWDDAEGSELWENLKAYGEWEKECVLPDFDQDTYAIIEREIRNQDMTDAPSSHP